MLWPSLGVFEKALFVDVLRSPDKLGRLFGRLRFESNQAMQRKRDFSSPLVDLYGDKNDYAL